MDSTPRGRKLWKRRNCSVSFYLFFTFQRDRLLDQAKILAHLSSGFACIRELYTSYNCLGIYAVMAIFGSSFKTCKELEVILKDSHHIFGSNLEPPLLHSAQRRIKPWETKRYIATGRCFNFMYILNWRWNFDRWLRFSRLVWDLLEKWNVQNHAVFVQWERTLPLSRCAMN